MTLYYADTSALARAYLRDEPDHDSMRGLILDGDEAIISSELAAVELTAAMTAAERAGRIRSAARVMRRIDADLSGEAVSLLALEPATTFPTARSLIGRYPLFAADAIHLAVALVDAATLADEGDIALVTSDDRQAEAARAEGMRVWEPPQT